MIGEGTLGGALFFFTCLKSSIFEVEKQTG
jgi:hypothetical protein